MQPWVNGQETRWPHRLGTRDVEDTESSPARSVASTESGTGPGARSRLAAGGARRRGIPIGVYGELAGDPLGALL